MLLNLICPHGVYCRMTLTVNITKVYVLTEKSYHGFEARVHLHAVQ